MNINISMFSAKDAFDIGLQRTAHFKNKAAFRIWTMGFPYALRLEAALHKERIIAGAIEDAEREFDVIAAYLGGAKRLERIVDIGCGHALIDLFFSRRFGCQVHLVDIEETDTHHHDFRDAGAGYASLQAASRFLTGNGVPASAIRATNPQKSELSDSGCDLVFSLLSCGFHYPASTYGDFVAKALKPGGVFIFDMRKNSNQEAFLDRFDIFDIIDDTAKYRRVAAVKARESAI